MKFEMRNLIKKCMKSLMQEAEQWNEFLEADSQLNPNPDYNKIVDGFSGFFKKVGVVSAKDQESLILLMMNIYADNGLYSFYGPDPLEDFSLESIRDHETTISLIQEYFEVHKELESKGSQKLLSAMEQNLEFYQTMRSYLSQYWVKGKYKFNADIKKKQFVDTCLDKAQKVLSKTEAYTASENLWSVVYQERSSRKGTYFKSAYSRATKRKKDPQFAFKKSVSRYRG